MDFNKIKILGLNANAEYLSKIDYNDMNKLRYIRANYNCYPYNLIRNYIYFI